ncbi:hypothetical protein [uncultured Oscillibacter sp.]|uniref:hypothetical protein n=1 Tax=uncultured Oscillibacter sp. TaxID=876091 RepID=UPI002628DF4B|nr:hypothetical protein [uncultured Oscillibacter sp.]
MFDIEGIDDLIEQTRRLWDMYESFKKDVLRDNDDSVPHFSLTLGARVQKTPEGPKVHIEMEHLAYVVATLKEQKEKIERLLEGIDTLASAAAKFEAEMNGPNNSGAPQ